MKLVKTQIVLFIYERLLTNGSITSDEVKSKFLIEDKTFFRYIAEIRAYLSNFYSNKELSYSRSTHTYYLQ